MAKKKNPAAKAKSEQLAAPPDPTPEPMPPPAPAPMAILGQTAGAGRFAVGSTISTKYGDDCVVRADMGGGWVEFWVANCAIHREKLY